MYTTTEYKTAQRVSIRHDKRRVYIIYSFTGQYAEDYSVEQPLKIKAALRFAHLILKHAIQAQTERESK